MTEIKNTHKQFSGLFANLNKQFQLFVENYGTIPTEKKNVEQTTRKRNNFIIIK